MSQHSEGITLPSEYEFEQQEEKQQYSLHLYRLLWFPSNKSSDFVQNLFNIFNKEDEAESSEY